MMQPLWKMVWRLLKNLGIKPPYDPAIPFLGIYPKETKIEKDTLKLAISLSSALSFHEIVLSNAIIQSNDKTKTNI